MLASNAVQYAGQHAGQQCWRAKMLDSIAGQHFQRMNMFILFENAGQLLYL
jgi:hypothetical protein